MKTKRIVSIVLSVLMACSVFAGLSVAADDTTEHTYTVVGDAAFLGASWAPATEADDMALQADGTYKKTYTGVAASDCYTIKVAQDHAWDVSFGATLGEANPANIEFSVPEDNSTVDVILTLSGTRDKDGVEIPDGTVKVLVNGTDAPGKVVPQETAHYVAGEAGLCNGVAWNQADETNKMTKNADGTYEITFKGVQPKDEAGTPYEFKVTTNGAWEPAYDYNGEIAPGGANAQVPVTAADSTVKIVLTTESKVRVWVNDVEITPAPVETTTKEPETTDPIGNTSAVTSQGGIYTGPTDGSASRRYFFAMPKEWKTFNNAMACAYWWDGTDACTDWQHSYQMRSTALTTEDGSKVYYIDVAETVGTIIFNNGIDGGVKPAEGEEPSPNWGKNFQTVNVNLEGYDAGESAVYPDGVENFANMIYVVDPSKVDVNELSGATTYGGEWNYLHADGKWDTTKGTTYEVKDITAVIPKTASTYVGKTTTIKATLTNAADNAEKVWSSNKTSVATVDQNGKVTGKGKGTAVISLSVKNPGDAEYLVVSCTVTVKQLVTSVKLNATSKTIYNGKTTTLKATVSPATANNKTLTYTTSNKSVATISVKNGVITVKGVKPGVAYIKATAKDGSKKSASCKVTVKAQKATKLTVNKKTATLAKKGASTTIKATLAPSNTYNKQIKVSTSNKKYVKISTSKINSGKTVKITAVKKGKATIKFVAADGSKKSAQTKVTVKK